MATAEMSMENAWSAVLENMFYPEKGLIYDYRCGKTQETRFQYFPRQEEIAAQFPSPCGWGSGLEDCMLNAGSALDILRLRKQLTDEDNTGLAEQIVRGIAACATVHGQKGFLARGLTPDGSSCYMNTSRDQYTLAAFGLWRFLHGWPEASIQIRKLAVDTLAAMASYCERVVTPENNYSLLRLDGQPGLVCKMLDCDVHEHLRLPMIYAIAYDASGDMRWKNLAEKYTTTALERSNNLDADLYWWDITYMQMQISLAVFHELSDFTSLRTDFAALMQRLAVKTLPDFMIQLEKAEKFDGNWTPSPTDWRRRSYRIHPEVFRMSGGRGVYRNYCYLLPEQLPEFALAEEMLRSLGNDRIALELAPESVEDENVNERFFQLIEKIDLKNCMTSRAINLIHGYWLSQQRKRDKHKS